MAQANGSTGWLNPLCKAVGHASWHATKRTREGTRGQNRITSNQNKRLLGWPFEDSENIRQIDPLKSTQDTHKMSNKVGGSILESSREHRNKESRKI